MGLGVTRQGPIQDDDFAIKNPLNIIIVRFSISVKSEQYGTGVKEHTSPSYQIEMFLKFSRPISKLLP